jgi:hypothetical protein
MLFDHGGKGFKRHVRRDFDSGNDVSILKYWNNLSYSVRWRKVNWADYTPDVKESALYIKSREFTKIPLTGIYS